MISAQIRAAIRLRLLFVGLFAARATAVCPVVPVHSVQHVRVVVNAADTDHLLKAPPLGCLRSATARQCHTASSRQWGVGTRNVGAHVHTPRVWQVGSSFSSVLATVAGLAMRHAPVVDTVSSGQGL